MRIVQKIALIVSGLAVSLLCFSSGSGAAEHTSAFDVPVKDFSWEISVSRQTESASAITVLLDGDNKKKQLLTTVKCNNTELNIKFFVESVDSKDAGACESGGLRVNALISSANRRQANLADQLITSEQCSSSLKYQLGPNELRAEAQISQPSISCGWTKKPIAFAPHEDCLVPLAFSFKITGKASSQFKVDSCLHSDESP